MHSELFSLKEGMERLSLQADNETMERFLIFLKVFDKWSGYYRLVSTRDHKTIIQDHILDSLSAIPLIRRDETVNRLCDIGAGAGFPGLCIALAMPDLSVTLLDARAHRIEFLRTVIRNAGLQNCIAHHLHLPLVGDQFIKHKALFNIFDVIVARAVASIEEIIRLGYPHLRLKGRFILHRGKNARKEVEEIQKLLSTGSICLQSLEQYDPIDIDNAHQTAPRTFLVTLRKECDEQIANDSGKSEVSHDGTKSCPRPRV